MTPRASDLVFLVLAALLFRSATRPGDRGATTPRGLPPGNHVPRTPTGDADFITWFRRRRALCIAVLRNMANENDLPDPRLFLSDRELDEVSLSILAQWAHETARGKSEFNFNLGGWRARRSDDFFTARDNLTPGTEVFRWTAYPDLATAVDDQVHRLYRGFPNAFRSLLLEPGSSEWVEQLGRAGYYTADPREYARAWAMHRVELGGIA